ncbi:hypothetical protein PCIT_a3049 [Pseudoalteromonas citrea]|uniref:Uncharacterized protein n=1 Tax=Pseudoalteromonas citrea TaxID=43655 RepID=A0AAD4FRP2_9GAMM|nr:hypothetical protein PCIT_a3049 [Pseudoalteromonas citrea]
MISIEVRKEWKGLTSEEEYCVEITEFNIFGLTLFEFQKNFKN